MNRATVASGSVTRNTEPHSNPVSSAPASSGPNADIAPPRPDQSAMARVRCGPDHSGVISARVVGKAMPAARPPASRESTSVSTEPDSAAAREAGIASAVPSSSIRFRP